MLYLEADGVWVHLQQEGLPYYEVKSAIAYEGWRRLPQKKERYALVGKRVYGHGDEALPFWEAASLEWGRRWDLSQVEQVVIGGDGASWIDEGLEWFPGAVRQRDGFHLARSCHRALGWAEGQGVYQAIREGKREEALKLLSRAKPRPGEHAKKALASVRRQVDKGVDWRRQGVKVPSGARGLGTMESQGDKLIANRMKKRGMSWTIGGAQRMAKVIQLVANGELGQWCGRPPSSREKGIFTPAPQGKRHRAREPGEGLQAKIPALTGPHASRPWVQALRHLAYDSFPVN